MSSCRGIWHLNTEIPAASPNSFFAKLSASRAHDGRPQIRANAGERALDLKSFINNSSSLQFDSARGAKLCFETRLQLSATHVVTLCH